MLAEWTMSERIDEIVFPTGSLDIERAIFRTLPVDLTFVDEEDRVRFFSEGPERVFMRPRTVIGRKASPVARANPGPAVS
jgi:DUF438 domain-containing protein